MATPINPAEQLRTPEQPRPVEASPERTPRTPEEQRQRLHEAGQQAIETSITKPGEVRLKVIEHLGGEGLDAARAALDRAQTAANKLLADLEAELQPAANEQPSVPPVEPVVEPVSPKPSVDGVVPPSLPKEVDGAAGDEELPEEFQAAAATTVAAEKTVEAIDPNAERNTASAGLLEQLKQDDYSIPGQSNLDLLKQTREVILRHNNETLAVRYDTDGNVVIGVPEDGGDGLRTRLITISHNEISTIEWLKRARPQDYLTLQRHRIAVIEDPQLQHDPPVTPLLRL